MTKKETLETRYYITSLKDVELCAEAIRGHWSVESLHWHLDVNFGEDDNTTMDKNAFTNLSILLSAFDEDILRDTLEHAKKK